MPTERVQRRLAAILAADIVGYSRLMEADEAGTLARIKTLRAEFLHPKVAAFGGRIVKTTGDGTLIEFPSAVDAVQHAVEVQREMAVRGAREPESQRIVLRMGINLGDIIIDGDDIYGDGVNVAARLETLAEPGGICISGTVQEHVRNKLDAAFEDMGAQTLKNIAQPVQVYRVRVLGKAEHKAAAPALPLPERPSIAVLPFANMSGDPEQEYFADGIAEDIITALSRFRQFFVIARNSSFIYKGRNVDVRQIGRELGIRYVLEGSVRKGGSRLRITAQLVDAATGNHLWAEKYDGALAEVFDLQDKITEAVVGAIEPSVRQAEIERARCKRPDNLDAYDLYLRALPHAWTFLPGEAAKAINLLEQALWIDPSYIAAHGLAAYCHQVRFIDRAEWVAALRHARAVLTSNTDDSVALALSAFVVALFTRDYDAALDAIGRALALTPNSAMVLVHSAATHSFAGRYDTAIQHAERSLRLSPLDPMRYRAEIAVGWSHLFSGRYAEAAEAAQRAINANVNYAPGHEILIASRVFLGQLDMAHTAAARFRDAVPRYQISAVMGGRFSTELNDKLADALRSAGVPQ